MFKKYFRFSKIVVLNFYTEGCFGSAAALAYTTLLSLVPLFTVAFSVLAAFPVFKAVAFDMQRFILNNFVATSAETIQQHLAIFIEQTAKLPAWGLLFLLITAVLLVFSMEQAFNQIWHVAKRREGIKAFLLYWGVLTLLPILVGVGMVASSYFMKLPFVSDATFGLQIKVVLFYVSPYLLTFTAFTWLYEAMPNCDVPLKSALVAAAPTTILFELAKSGFAFYISNFPTYKLIYGALATLPIFLMWLYCTWLIILFGAVVGYNHAREVKKNQ